MALNVLSIQGIAEGLPVVLGNKGKNIEGNLNLFEGTQE